MEQWLFMGGCDKRDLLLYTCKMLVLGGSRVLLVDLSDGQMYRYLLRTGIEELTVTEYNGFDITWSMESAEVTSYDYCLCDLGTGSKALDSRLENADHLLWVSTSDHCELGKSKEWLETICKQSSLLQGREILPIFIRALDSISNHSYAMSMLAELPLAWKENMILIPWNEGNEEIRLANEHSGMIVMRRISRAYKQALKGMVRELTGWTRTEVSGALRQAERRGA